MGLMSWVMIGLSSTVDFISLMGISNQPSQQILKRIGEDVTLMFRPGLLVTFFSAGVGWGEDFICCLTEAIQSSLKAELISPLWRFKNYVIPGLSIQSALAFLPQTPPPLLHLESPTRFVF